MKKTIFYSITIICIMFISSAFSQTEGEFWVRYHINQKNDKYKVYFKSKDSVVTYKKGWTGTKTVGDKEFEYTLDQDTQDSIKIYEPVDLDSRWIAGEVKYTDKEPGKLYFNPWQFEEDSKYNKKGYIKVPNNGAVRLRKTFGKISPLIVPFAIRFKLNDSIRSQSTSDLNLGVGLSYNVNWDNFKNRRVKAVRTSYGISFGLGAGFSKVSLTSSNTSLAEEPLENAENGLALTFAPGIGINLQQVSIAAFYAYDIALTDNVMKWNYYKKGYLGIGFGIKLSTFGALKG